MRYRSFPLFIILFLLSMPMMAYAQSTFVAPSGTYDGPLQGANPVIVELFSSENCPACPPADDYLKILSGSDGVIALSCHVDYFGEGTANLGQSFCTDRQTQYIKQIKRKSHFTPQMMINGHMSEIGYETNKVSAAIVKGRSERLDKINIQPKSAGVYDFSLKPRNITNTTDLILFVYDKPHDVSQRGRKITYKNVVSKLLSLGTWNGGAMNSAVYPLVDNNSAGFTIIAQDRETGKIFAAGDFKL